MGRVGRVSYKSLSRGDSGGWEEEAEAEAEEAAAGCFGDGMVAFGRFGILAFTCAAGVHVRP